MQIRNGLLLRLALASLCALAATAQGAAAADKVTFVTDFGFNGRHAYYFVALDKGYYAKQNLHVQIVRGQTSPRKEVLIVALAAEVIEQRLA